LDYKILLDKIEDAYSKELPFVTYRKPNDKVVKGIFQKKPILNFSNNYTEKGFLFAPFNNKEDVILFRLENSDSYCASLPTGNITFDAKYTTINNDLRKDNYINLVGSCIDFIKRGKAKKVVLSRREDLDLTNFSITKIFEKLIYNYSNAFAYIWYHPKVGLWFGATPEQLVNIKLNAFNTVSLAGTQVYKDSLDVIWNKKELEEQQIVTNYMESNLNSLVDNLSISSPTTTKAGNLLHLKTSIKGLLNDKFDLKNLIDILHPTPAVCGMPKRNAKEFILKNEGYNRQFYTGFLGELNIDNSSDLFVNLRCMKVKNSIASLFIGGGITIDSIPENEWMETVEKSKVMKKVLSN
jgi:isochorismate synthase